MSKQTLNALCHLFLALSDKTRLRLLALMTAGEVSVGFLAESLGESQPKISRHLAYLRGAGIVSTRRDGKWIYYAITDQSDPVAEAMLSATLRSLGGKAPMSPREPRRANYNEAFEQIENISAEPYIYEEQGAAGWAPSEIEVFLL